MLIAIYQYFHAFRSELEYRKSNFIITRRNLGSQYILRCKFKSMNKYNLHKTILINYKNIVEKMISTSNHPTGKLVGANYQYQ